MDEEQIIRKEAVDFFSNEIRYSNNENSIYVFHEIKNRLQDFYSPENKSIFLDEIEKSIKFELEEHREEKHNGIPHPTCVYEVSSERLLFYIKQEIDTLPIIAHQKFETKNKKEKNKVFISYSHLDKEFLNDIQRHFKPFVKDIDYWDDEKILPGQIWKEEIKNAIEETKVAILLVSTDFLGSEFIANDELPYLLKSAEKEGTVILIVVLKPCLFEEFNELNKYQTMNPPSRPVTKMNYDEKEELFVNLVRQTKRVLNL